MPQRRAGPARRVVLEVCVESVDDAVAVAAGGADRIELNCALALDGLTPTPGLLTETRRAVRVPIVTMARPRAGDFCYSESEFRALRRDVDYALEHGADGVAFGVLTDDGRIDTRRCRTIVRQCRSNQITLVFHRAFDTVRNPLDSLEQLIDLGVHRIMTSGGRPAATDGAALIRLLLDRAAGRIEILPAGGIRPTNVRRVISETGCDQIHTSLRDRAGRMSLTSLGALVRRLRP